MSRHPHRYSHQQPLQYAVVPQSPSRSSSVYASHPAGYVGGPRQVVRSASTRSYRRDSQGQQHHQARQVVAMGVATGTIGAGYGPYSYHPQQAQDSGLYNNGRFTKTHSVMSTTTAHDKPTRVRPTTSLPQHMLDRGPDPDDPLHNPDPRGDFDFRPFSLRGWMNICGIFLLLVGLLTLFLGYPVLVALTTPKPHISGWNVGGINATGQIPEFTNFPRLIDSDTPDSALTRVGYDGNTYDLVFSDEFNADGRSFYPGDDPYWEAADIHYWPTGDAEWYDPSAVTTQDGKLVITVTEQRTHDLNFQSGMLTSWNKMCFNTGYIEISVSLPGSPKAPGLWPGAWTLGNLGRAGYGATTEGMWPYSYDTCDLGTFPAQQQNGQPAAATTGGNGGTILSGLPGQKLSACTCPGSDHPGPRVDVGRGVPEIDIIEAQVDVTRMQGQASQSFQIAPYDLYYNYNDSEPATVVHNQTITHLNTYKGGPLQEALSALTDIDDRYYGGQEFVTLGYEWWSDPNHRSDGYITWFYDHRPTWTVTAASIGPNAQSQVSSRLIPEEPMYVILNVGMSTSFQAPDFKHMQFPTKMYVDYVRIYQRRGLTNGVTCNPPNRPTTDYISKHLTAYMNANLTTWKQANLTIPRNRLFDGC